MLYINGIWKMDKTVEDLIKIVKEDYNSELADKLNECFKDLEGEINDLELRLNDAKYANTE